MNTGADGDAWLAKVLPIVRPTPYVTSFSIGTLGAKQRIIALDREALLVIRTSRNAHIPEQAFQPGGLEFLRSMRENLGGLLIPLESILSVDATAAIRFSNRHIGLSTDVLVFTVKCADRKRVLNFNLPCMEAEHLVEALGLLLGDRFHARFFGWQVQAGVDTPPTRMRRADAPHSEMRAPFRSRPIGLLVIILAVLLYVGLPGALYATGRICDLAVREVVAANEPSPFYSQYYHEPWDRRDRDDRVAMLSLLIYCISIIVAFVTMIGGVLLVRRLLLAGYRMRSRSVTEMQAVDPRSPILYLRCFDNDGLPGPDPRRALARHCRGVLLFIPRILIGALLFPLVLRYLRGRAELT